jgi:MFS family permease
MSWADTAVVLSVVLLLVALGHTHEDAAFGSEPPLAEFLGGAVLVGIIVLAQLVGLAVLRTNESLGLALSGLAGAAWALLFTFAHIGEALTLDWRYGLVSSAWVLGGIALGAALALIAGWSLLRRRRRG